MRKRFVVLLVLLAFAVSWTGCRIETPMQHEQAALSSGAPETSGPRGEEAPSAPAEPSGTAEEGPMSVPESDASRESQVSSAVASTAPASTEKSPKAPEAATPSGQASQPPSSMPAPPPSSAPASAAPSQAPVLMCTISIDCKTALAYEGLDTQIKALLPVDGMLLAPRTVAFEKGETVLDVLLREAAAAQIAVTQTGGGRSAYIRGFTVNGTVSLFEKDCGSLSGWNYLVNGEIPGVGAGSCKLKEGDRIQWRYSCNMGNDLK